MTEVIFPDAGKNPAFTTRTKIQHGVHVHTLRRWRELALHNLTAIEPHRISKAKLMRILGSAKGTGTVADPKQLHSRLFYELLQPSRRFYLPAREHRLVTSGAPFPAFLACPPELRKLAIAEALAQGYSYLNLLHYVYATHLQMLGRCNPTTPEQDALRAWIQRAYYDTLIPNSYMQMRDVPPMFADLLTPADASSATHNPTTPLHPLHPTAFP